MTDMDNKQSGNVYCNKSILLSIVSLATKEVNGVCNTFSTLGLKLKKIVSSDATDGVEIKFTKKGLIVDIYITIELGFDVNDVVYRVQQNVKNSIASMIDIAIKSINVHIMDSETA